MHKERKETTHERVGERNIYRAWDLYFQIPTSIVQAMSNDRFIIPELIFPIGSKRRVTYYPKVT